MTALRSVVGTLCAAAVLAACSVDGDSPAEAPDDTAHAPIVVVLNGCGVTGAARKVSEVVRAAGYDVGSGYGENADSFAYPSTLVVDLVGDREPAEKLAEHLGVQMIQQISHDPDRFGSIAVIVGANYRKQVARKREE